MIWSQQRFAKARQLFLPVLKKALPLLLPASLLIWGIEYAVSTVHKMRFASPYDTSTAMILGSGIAAFLGNIILSVVWIVVSTWATIGALLPKETKPLFSDFHQTLIEHTRRLLSTLLWSLVFVIPGFFRWLRLFFTAHVALLNPEYAKGHVDALKRSSDIVRGSGLALGFLLLIQGGISFGLESLGAEVWPAFFPLGILFYAISWCVSLYCAIYLTLTYKFLDKQHQ